MVESLPTLPVAGTLKEIKMTPFDPNLQPMGIGDILDRTFHLYKEHFANFVGITGLASLLAFAFNVALLSFFIPLGADPARLLANPVLIFTGGIALVALLVITVWIGFLSMGALSRSVSERYLGRAITVLEAYRQVAKRGLSLLWVYLLSSLIIVGVFVLGSLLSIVAAGVTGLAGEHPNFLKITLALLFVFIPTIIFVTILIFRYLLITQVVVLEDVRGTKALRRSWHLMKGYFWKANLVLLLYLVLFGIGYLLLYYPTLFFLPRPTPGTIGAVGATYVAQNALSQLIQMLVSPFSMIAFTLLYYDSRIRKEGFDLEVMARNLGYGAPPPGPSPGQQAAPVGVTGVAPGAGNPYGQKTCPGCGFSFPKAFAHCPRCGSRVPFRPPHTR